MPDTWTQQQAGDWSRASNNTDSPWYDAGVQAARASIPVSGDTVNGLAVTNLVFDVDQIGFASGLAGFDLKGCYLIFKEGMTTYLKMAGDFTSTVEGAKVKAGTSASVEFTTASDATIYMNGAFALKATTSNNITWEIYCSEPIVKSIRLSGAEAAGQTVLSVNADVTSYTNHWKAGAIIRIDDYNGQDSEERTIAAGGVGAYEITITAGLTNAKISGAYVHLISRNFRILCGATTVNTALVQYGRGTLNAEIRPGNTNTNCFRGSLITLGGTMSACNYFVTSSIGLTINSIMSGALFGILNGKGCNLNGHLSGCNTGIYGGINNSVSPTGKITGCSVGISYYSLGLVISGTIAGNDVGVTGCSGILLNAIFKENITCDLNGRCNFRGYNSSLLSTQVIYFVNTEDGASASGYGQITIDDYAGVTDANYGWMYAGTYEPAGVGEELTDGVTIKFNPLVATHPTYKDYSLGNLSEGQKVEIRVYMKHSATGFTQRGKLEVFHWSDDPFFGGTAIYSWTAADNTYEQFSGYEFEAAKSGEYFLRISCKNAGGNLWESTVFSVLSEELTTLERIEDYVDTLETLLGTPVALDGGAATIAGMLTKMADDNGGADYDAGVDSLHEKQGTSAADVADAVWDEAIADHNGAGTFGTKNQKVVPSETINDYKATGFAVAGDAMTLTADYDAAKTAAQASDLELAIKLLRNAHEISTDGGGTLYIYDGKTKADPVLETIELYDSDGNRTTDDFVYMKRVTA